MNTPKKLIVLMLIILSILNTAMAKAVRYDPVPVIPDPYPQPYVPSPGGQALADPDPLAHLPVPPDPVREAMARAFGPVVGRSSAVFVASTPSPVPFYSHYSPAYLPLRQTAPWRNDPYVPQLAMRNTVRIPPRSVSISPRWPVAIRGPTNGLPDRRYADSQP